MEHLRDPRRSRSWTGMTSGVSYSILIKRNAYRPPVGAEEHGCPKRLESECVVGCWSSYGPRSVHRLLFSSSDGFR